MNWDSSGGEARDGVPQPHSQATELRRQVDHGFVETITEGWMVIYMARLLVFSRNVGKHLQHLRRALQLLREAQWSVEAQNCLFFMQTISCSGSRVSAAGVEPDPAKIGAIQRWLPPLHMRTDVQKFLGRASYHRNSIPEFARIAAPLADLLKKNKQFIWTDNKEEATRRLIGHLRSSPVLAVADFDKPFLLTTDASDSAVEVMLSRQANSSKRHKTVAFYPHPFTERKQKFPVTEKELYSAWWAVKKYWLYLYDRQSTVQTDHQSLTHLTKSFQDYDNERIVRWLSKLAQYDFTVEYIKGITNVVANALSRRPTGQATWSATVFVCDGSRFLSKLLPSYSLDTQVVAVLTRATGRTLQNRWLSPVVPNEA
ncbi:uncharacterized protein EMH_0021760 [Eimeria mitis]|uniref:Reverse transcriptase RNase H-like domain-containing protein n=1 Tax=Eimeria mitis TaxID=44415 RepID=U6KK39_9EIME|nr:uncharacterized protein EMH_0021760 [Eimeria mitis]CDJ36637.1 hypothetical protein EMH_0021760 [Eimeria mitis]